MISFKFPSAPVQAGCRSILAFYPLEAFIRAGSQHCLFKACRTLIRRNPADAPVNPLGYSAIGIMVQAVHSCIAYFSVGQHRIPSFPDGGCPHIYFVQPAREILLEKEGIGFTGKPRLGQRLAKIGRSHKSGVQTVPVQYQNTGRAPGPSGCQSPLCLLQLYIPCGSLPGLPPPPFHNRPDPPFFPKRMLPSPSEGRNTDNRRRLHNKDRSFRNSFFCICNIIFNLICRCFSFSPAKLELTCITAKLISHFPAKQLIYWNIKIFSFYVP